MPQAYDPNWRRPEDEGEALPLDALLTSAPVHQLQAEGKGAARIAMEGTDFATLRPKYGMQRNVRNVPLTFSDYLIDALTPTLLFFMMTSFLLFVLDVRFIFTETEDLRLRTVSIFFVLGIVALNRLISRDGKEQSVLYIIGLAVVVFLFTVSSSTNSGAYVRNDIQNIWIELAINMGMVSFLWWVINRLTHECCVDKASSSGEVGLWRGTVLAVQRAAVQAQALPAELKALNRAKVEEPYILENVLEPYDPIEGERQAQLDALAAPEPKTWKDRMPGTHPGISIFYVSLPILAVFVLGFPILQNGGPGMVKVGYVFVGLYTLCAIGLLMLTSLRGLRGYCQERGVSIPPGVSMFWMGFGGFLVAVVILVGLLGPTPTISGAWDVGPRELDPNARHGEQWDYREYESTTPADNPAPTDKDLAGNTDASQAGKDDRAGSNAGEEGTQNDDIPPTPPNDGSTGGKSSTPQMESPLLQMMQGSEIVRVAVIGVLVVGGALLALLIFLYVLRALSLRQRSERPGILRGLRRLLEGLLAGFAVPGMRPLRVRINRSLSASAVFRNPMSSPMPLREKVVYSYDALCALAQDVGQPRDPDRTPHEFIREFPERLAWLKEEAEDLTRLFVIAQYSNLEIQPQVEDRIRKFWTRYDAMRNGVVR